ncbi:alpha/beta hydrolase [Thermomonospora umbrina]|uniref:Pimeloyl-ACP methyl ester carboxylesterase n=1 Tax=Thermomonospora umbrina TaxID=111806 RepID=A0A3D9T7D1_9ACTN|nr:alpha/beta hydrolase [Thermomonospora umbrina]REF00585.1 pimeloyl-ACP methyl ester carboxylesterase [Thermomonospora umbrina]
MGRRVHSSVAVAVAATSVVSVIAAVPARPVQAATLTWGACPTGVSTELQCANLTLPLNYRDPAGGTVTIKISRLASADPTKRRGVLLVNPGGPGNSGLGQPITIKNRPAPRSLLEAYDIIGFDPRGVGWSSPVRCGLQNINSTVAPYALTTQDVVTQSGVADAMADTCAGSAVSPLLPHITTANTARDMDQIRAALGETRISYYGVSYGSALGAAYASMFPGRTDRILLDSIVGDTYMGRDAWRSFGQGVEDRFPDFARHAAANHATYSIGSTPEQVRANFFTLARRLDVSPLGDVNGIVFRRRMFSALYRDSAFPGFARLWQTLANGQVPAPTTPTTADNYVSAQLAITCGDSAWPRDVATYQADVEEDRIDFPLFGPAAANIYPCAHWSVPPVELPAQVTATGPVNIMLLQNARDPATPLNNALKLRRKFGARARLITADQGGHGVFHFTNNACANDHGLGFLVNGTLPDSDRLCPAE